MLLTIAIISSFSIFIPFFIGLKFYKSLRSKVAKVFFAFIVLTTITELINVVYSLLKINNIWLNNLYVFVPLITFQLILFFEKSFRVKTSYLLNILLVIIYFAGVFNMNDIYKFDSINYVISSLILVFMCSVLLFRVFDHVKIIEHSFLFWISSGMLFYASTTIVLYGLLNSLMSSEKQFLWFYTIPQTIINVSVNIVFAKALYGTDEK